MTLRALLFFAAAGALAAAPIFAQSCVGPTEPCALRHEARPPWTTNSLGMRLLLVGGEGRDFYLAATTVAAGPYAGLMDGSGSPDDDGAPVLVAAADAAEFCRRLSALSGASYRLPTPGELALADPESRAGPEWVIVAGGVLALSEGDAGTARFRVVRDVP